MPPLLGFWKRSPTDSREQLKCPCAAREGGKSSADKDCRERSRAAVENLTTPEQLARFSSRGTKRESRNV